MIATTRSPRPARRPFPHLRGPATLRDRGRRGYVDYVTVPPRAPRWQAPVVVAGLLAAVVIAAVGLIVHLSAT